MASTAVAPGPGLGLVPPPPPPLHLASDHAPIVEGFSSLAVATVGSAPAERDTMLLFNIGVPNSAKLADRALPGMTAVLRPVVNGVIADSARPADLPWLAADKTVVAMQFPRLAFFLSNVCGCELIATTKQLPNQAWTLSELQGKPDAYTLVSEANPKFALGFMDGEFAMVPVTEPSLLVGIKVAYHLPPFERGSLAEGYPYLAVVAAGAAAVVEPDTLLQLGRGSLKLATLAPWALFSMLTSLRPLVAGDVMDAVTLADLPRLAAEKTVVAIHYPLMGIYLGNVGDQKLFGNRRAFSSQAWTLSELQGRPNVYALVSNAKPDFALGSKYGELAMVPVTEYESLVGIKLTDLMQPVYKFHPKAASAAHQLLAPQQHQQQASAAAVPTNYATLSPAPPANGYSYLAVAVAGSSTPVEPGTLLQLDRGTPKLANVANWAQRTMYATLRPIVAGAVTDAPTLADLPHLAAKKAVVGVYFPGSRMYFGNVGGQKLYSNIKAFPHQAWTLSELKGNRGVYTLVSNIKPEFALGFKNGELDMVSIAERESLTGVKLAYYGSPVPKVDVDFAPSPAHQALASLPQARPTGAAPAVPAAPAQQQQQQATCGTAPPPYQTLPHQPPNLSTGPALPQYQAPPPAERYSYLAVLAMGVSTLFVPGTLLQFDRNVPKLAARADWSQPTMNASLRPMAGNAVLNAAEPADLPRLAAEKAVVAIYFPGMRIYLANVGGQKLFSHMRAFSLQAWTLSELQGRPGVYSLVSATNAKFALGFKDGKLAMVPTIELESIVGVKLAYYTPPAVQTDVKSDPTSVLAAPSPTGYTYAGASTSGD
ncbi:hypothetical protein H9P43_002674 [Blastocladiella emersonii ATCC 22665]|nr:hypothetical protein H9P43_002674 [Blastocladiella emersonii ATCC 22665]